MASSLQKAVGHRRQDPNLRRHERIITYVAVDGWCGSLPELSESLLLHDASCRAQHPAVRDRPTSGSSITMNGSFALDLQSGFCEIQRKCHCGERAGNKRDYGCSCGETYHNGHICDPVGSVCTPVGCRDRWGAGGPWRTGESHPDLLKAALGMITQICSHQTPSLSPLFIFCRLVMQYAYFPRDSGLKILFQLFPLNKYQSNLLLSVSHLQFCPAWWQHTLQSQEQPHGGCHVIQTPMQVNICLTNLLKT